MSRVNSSNRDGSYGAGTSSYSTKPQWNTRPRPMVHPYVPTTSSRTQQQQLQQQQNGIAPHLHPQYSGRGRPPLALGRKTGTMSPYLLKKYGSQSLQQSSYGSNAAATPSSSSTTAAAASAAAAAAAAALQPRSRKPIDGKEIAFLNAGTTNRLLLSLRSGLPTHVTWALNRLTQASCHHLESLALDAFPGMTDSLLRFPRRLISALKGEEVEKWEPTFWEQEERELDGMGKGAWQDVVLAEDNSEEDDIDEEDDGVQETASTDTTTTSIRNIPAVFSPGEIPSHRRLLEQAVAAMLVLRNLSMSERNERIFLAYSRSINSLICDIMSLTTTRPSLHLANEWSEMQGIEEMQIYALDILEVTRVRLHIRKRCSITFDPRGIPVSFPVYTEPVDQDASTTAATGSSTVEDEMFRAARRAAAGTSDFLFNLLIWHLHTSSDRSILMGCLRCLGALAAEEKNEAAFVEMDVSLAPTSRQNGLRRLTGVTSTASFSSPGILKKCLNLLPLTQDSALLEAALDCLYQIINIGDNALRMATCTDDGVAPLGIGIGRPECAAEDGSERGVGDVRSIMRLLSRNLIYGRVVWDRTHQLTLHPALHGHVPSAVAARRKEKDEIYRKRRAAEGDDRERSKLRKLQRNEWLEVKDLAEPERLKAWMQLIYEPREGGEVTQMEFWTTYSNQFGPYATLGGPALQPAAEVIRTVSSVFPGALAMVIQNSKFIVRGVEARDRSVMRKFECKWKACHAPETDTLEAVQGHIKAHCSMASDGKCQWSTCFYAVHDSVVGESSRILDLQLHTLTHLPESDEQIEARERLEKERYREEDLMMTKALKSQEIRPAIMTNGARYISGPTALMPNSTFAAEKRRIELDRVEVKRRKLLNTPVRGTVDMPDILVFSVTRTPMDPDTSKPTGISSTSGLILRSLARTTATILIKAGVREKRKLPENKASQSGQYERFGLPLPVSSAAEVDVKADLPESGVDGNGATAGTGGIGPVEDWALQAASRIMDALLDVEDQIMAVASENDILCPMLNETLVELKPEPGESIWTEPEDESSL